MRRLLVYSGSFASGIFTIIVSSVLLLMFLSMYDRYVLGITPQSAEVYGRHLLLFVLLVPGMVVIPVLISAFGCFVGFWFLRKKLLS